MSVPRYRRRHPAVAGLIIAAGLGQAIRYAALAIAFRFKRAIPEREVTPISRAAEGGQFGQTLVCLFLRRSRGMANLASPGRRIDDGARGEGGAETSERGPLEARVAGAVGCCAPCPPGSPVLRAKPRQGLG